VVSNNSAAAIEAYLTAHGLTTYVSPIIGRAYAGPYRMKPDPRGHPMQTEVRKVGDITTAVLPTWLSYGRRRSAPVGALTPGRWPSGQFVGAPARPAMVSGSRCRGR
jgi:hypothetical protein